MIDTVVVQYQTPVTVHLRRIVGSYYSRRAEAVLPSIAKDLTKHLAKDIADSIIKAL